jgi:hypothetical protein
VGGLGTEENFYGYYIDQAVCRPAPWFVLGRGALRGNRLRMVGETIMIRHDVQVESAPNSVVKGMGGLTHDIVALAELQFELFKIDCREGLKRALGPLVVLVVAATVALGSVPILLMFVAELLVQAGGVSRAVAFAVATVVGFAVAAALGVGGWSALRKIAHIFERSSKEWTGNMAWLKHALKRSAHMESQQPQEG